MSSMEKRGDLYDSISPTSIPFLFHSVQFNKPLLKSYYGQDVMGYSEINLRQILPHRCVSVCEYSEFYKLIIVDWRIWKWTFFIYKNSIHIWINLI